jgi:hypothetical protein
VQIAKPEATERGKDVELEVIPKSTGLMTRCAGSLQRSIARGTTVCGRRLALPRYTRGVHGTLRTSRKSSAAQRFQIWGHYRNHAHLGRQDFSPLRLARRYTCRVSQATRRYI